MSKAHKSPEDNEIAHECKAQQEEAEGQAEVSTHVQRPKKRLYVNLTKCKYESVRRAVHEYGLIETKGDKCTLVWTDRSVTLDQVKAMKRYQKINHFPGMNELYCKDLLVKNINRMAKHFPEEYNIIPRSWCLPAEYSDFQEYSRFHKRQIYICKPNRGSEGKGIFITKSSNNIKAARQMVCQVYVSKPFLISGYKFDLRLYVLVTSCDPLRIFMYREGLARFCTTKYMEPTFNNMKNVCMHLTNYSINKHSVNFQRHGITSSKRKISILTKLLQFMGHNTDVIWKNIEDAVIKTVISAHHILKFNGSCCFPNSCFEILGFDVLLDEELRPWVLEVNHSPSFTTDSQLDREVKDAVLYDTLVLINLEACDHDKVIEEERRRMKERLPQKLSREARSEELRQYRAAKVEHMDEYVAEHLGNFKRIYPGEDGEEYDKYFKQNSSFYHETAASKAREEFARRQMQKLRLKQEGGWRRASQGGAAGTVSTTARSAANLTPGPTHHH